MNYDRLLSEIFFVDDWHLNQSYLNKYKRHYKRRNKYVNIINYIENRYKDSTTFKETLYRIRHNCEVRPVCIECGKTVKFVGKGNKLFAQFCCPSCSGRNKEVSIKKQKADKEKHGGKLGWNINTPEKIEARKQGLIKKYGSWKIACDHIDKMRKQGVLTKYNVDNVMKCPEVQAKRMQSILQNCTFNKSKGEDKLYELLLQKFSKDDVKRQYRSEQYPFMCDFYIKSLDLYIEFQGSQYHNGTPFIGDKSDLNKLEYFKHKTKQIKDKSHKSKTQYDQIIYTWSDLDVRKRNIANNNNLNYVELWNINDAKYFVDNIDVFLNDDWKIISKHSCTKPNISTKHDEEQKLYAMLIKKFPDTKLHYKSKEYPFKCDFYIPKLDLYIEYNEYPIHGGKPFKKTKDDYIIADKIKKSFGSSMTFLVYDPYKRFVANKNKLNFVELWNFSEAKQYIKSLV